MASMKARFECSLLGHKERSFDVRFSPDGTQLLSASQDGTSRLFNVSTRRCTAVLKHSMTSEVLRAAFLDQSTVCTSGADGFVKIWSNSSGAFHVAAELSHGSEEQIYVCEPWLLPQEASSLLTASRDSLCLWDLSTAYSVHQHCDKRTFSSTASPYGGARNPDNIAYIFDAKPCLLPTSLAALHRTTAVALSDGTVRIVDIRTRRDALSFPLDTTIVDFTDDAVDIPASKRPRYDASTSSSPRVARHTDTVVNVLGSENFLGRQSHVTSVCWAPDGQSLVASLGNGDVAIIDTRQGIVRGMFRGCHASTCYGATPISIGRNSHTGEAAYTGIMSWSSDGTLRLWNEDNLLGSSILSSTLILQVPNNDPSTPFPIYSATARWFPPTGGTSKKMLIAIAGGSSALQFIGHPIHVINLTETLAGV